MSSIARDHALTRLCEGDQLSPATPFFQDPRDRRLYQELVRGVIRHRLLLDWHLARFCKRPLPSLDTPILNALRMGIYQIVFLKVPDHAAVSESVELVGRHKPDGKGFVNGILRSFLREEKHPAPPDVLIQTSFSEELANVLGDGLKWSGLPYEERPTLLTALNQPLPLTLRINTLRTTRPAFIEKLATDRYLTIRETPHSPDGVIVEGADDLTRLPGFREGEFVVQSEASQMISRLLGPFDKPRRILDACAAPGGKTTHIAQLQGDKGQITALSPSRRADPESATKRLRENIARLNLKSIEVVERTAEDYARKAIPGTFDAILVDAPCTGLGTLSKHPERKWMFKAHYINKLVAEQRSILHAVWPLLTPGGILVYSVCSLSVPEWSLGNECGVAMAPPDDLPPEAYAYLPDRKASVFWPHRFGSEGLFAARRRKPD